MKFDQNDSKKTLRFIRMPEVTARVGLSRSMLYNLIAQGTFPSQIKLSQRAAAWREDEVDAWMLSRLGGNVGSANENG